MFSANLFTSLIVIIILVLVLIEDLVPFGRMCKVYVK